MIPGLVEFLCGITGPIRQDDDRKQLTPVPAHISDTFTPLYLKPAYPSSHHTRSGHAVFIDAACQITSSFHRETSGRKADRISPSWTSFSSVLVQSKKKKTDSSFSVLEEGLIRLRKGCNYDSYL